MKINSGGSVGDSKEELLVYEGQEAVAGTVEILTGGKKVEHLGVKIEMIGLIGKFVCFVFFLCLLFVCFSLW